MLFVQLGDLHVHVHFGVVTYDTMALLVGTSLINQLVQIILRMDWRIVHIWPRQRPGNIS